MTRWRSWKLIAVLSLFIGAVECKTSRKEKNTASGGEDASNLPQ